MLWSRERRARKVEGEYGEDATSLVVVGVRLEERPEVQPLRVVLLCVGCHNSAIVHVPRERCDGYIKDVDESGTRGACGRILVLIIEASHLPRDATPTISLTTLIDYLASTPREHHVDHR